MSEAATDGGEAAHHQTVGEVATEEYVAVEETTTVEAAIDRFQAFDPTDDDATIYYIYVTDGQGRLTGVLSFREALNADNDTPVSAVMVSEPVALNAELDVEAAARQIRELEFPALPVTKSDGTLVGIARADDMVSIVEEEATEDIFKSAGFTFADVESARSEAILESSIAKILRLRLPWLLVALAGGLMAGLVIEGFEDTLEAVIVLGFFIPVIMDMGGNVGTQASTIFVRGLALGHIDDKNATKHFWRETKVGLAIGTIIGAVGAAAAYLWLVFLRGEPGDAGTIAFVLFVSLVAVCTIASLVGYVIPWLANKAGYDPAAVSDPLVTTVKDVTALVIYFGLATVLLAHLL